mgnify:CR=1 FL=1
MVYTREAETADAYIERATYEIARENPDRRVRVATSDNLEQLIILGHGAVRVPSTSRNSGPAARSGTVRRIWVLSGFLAGRKAPPGSGPRRFTCP